MIGAKRANPPRDQSSLFRGAVAWESIRQRIVVLSTCESEYIAAADPAKGLVLLQRLLSKLGLPQSTTVMHCDNRSAIATANTVVYSHNEHAGRYAD